MRLPINFFLYLVSTGLLGASGYTFYLTLEKSKGDVHKAEHERGRDESRDLIASGKGKGPIIETVVYKMQDWKNAWLSPNVLGKDPPKEKLPGEEPPVVTARPTDLRPLSDIIDLVALMHDQSAKGLGGITQIVVQYKEGVEVELPSWFLAERGGPAPAGAAGPVDGVPVPVGNQVAQGARRGGTPGVNRGGRRGPGTTTTPMPGSTAGMERLQVLVVDGDGKRGKERTLWPPFDDIRIKSVAANGRSAIFERAVPPAKEGDPPPPPREEELYLAAAGIGQDLIKVLIQLNKQVDQPPPGVVASLGTAGSWRDVEETTRIDDVWHIGRKDQEAMQKEGQGLFDRVQLGDYVSRTGTDLRGVQVLNVPNDVASRYGVQQGDLILAINGKAVSTRAEALDVGKRLYNKGVRTFVVKFLSAGREVERTYQAPEK